MIQVAQFESDLFNCKCGSVHIDDKYEKLENLDDFDFVEVKVPNMTLLHSVKNHLISCGFKFITSLATFETRNREVQIIDDFLIPYSHDYLVDCLGIVINSFVFPEDGPNKLNLDPRFKSSTIEKYYIQWFMKCISGHMADQVFVCKSNNEIVGLISLKKITNHKGHTSWNIPFVAVDREFRGRGYYWLMVKCLAKKIPLEDTITLTGYLNNLSHQHVWLRYLHGDISSITHIYHGGHLNEI